ncbi:hypothetical protein AQUCO_04900082v1 [Aquilegia coerulea]|uniref:rRNA-processing protein EFG1 n=1 Tax=Aquilegia coerulea TaxID=218851 RepID=A0A2G5CJU5_AQUCA|nr:hypothetical protein AQUCO_04900082v1 [Aquilegia coerulea]
MVHSGRDKHRGGGRGGGGGGNKSKSKSKGLLLVDKRRPKSLSIKNQGNKPKSVSLKNQIRSTERMLLRKSLPSEVKDALEKKLQDLKKQQDLQTRLAVERKLFLRDRKIKFFERRKIERRIRRLEKLQRTSNNNQDVDVSDQLSKLKEDLEYVRFFPKTEKYVSLFIGGDDADTVDRRKSLREKIKNNIMAAAASGKDLEETGSEDDGLLDMSDDDFFLAGSSSDEADADDEWTDKSAREQASSASGKATSGMSSDEKNQVSARALMPPPRPSKKSFRGPSRNQPENDCSSSKKPSIERVQMSTYGNKPHGIGGSSYRNQGSSNSTTGPSSNLSSNSDAHKPRRKRRPKKKKQQA